MHARDGVRAALARAGIDAVDVALDGPWDEAIDAMRAVIAVGGDGTVRAVAGRLAGRRVPLAIVPTGTENLAARAFGFRVGADRLAAAVRDGSTRRVDLGVIRRPGMREIGRAHV